MGGGGGDSQSGLQRPTKSTIPYLRDTQRLRFPLSGSPVQTNSVHQLHNGVHSKPPLFSSEQAMPAPHNCYTTAAAHLRFPHEALTPPFHTPPPPPAPRDNRLKPMNNMRTL